MEHIFSSYPHRHSSIVTRLNPCALHQDPAQLAQEGGPGSCEALSRSSVVCSLWPVLGALSATRWKVALAGNLPRLTRAPFETTQSNES